MGVPLLIAPDAVHLRGRNTRQRDLAAGGAFKNLRGRVPSSSLLPEVRRHANDEAHQLVVETCAALAAELADRYQGRLRAFLNP